MRNLITALLIAIPWICQAGEGVYCWQKAASRYNVPSLLIQAIGGVESNYDPGAENKYSKARGVMQIHPDWFPILDEKYGINERKLWDACTNIMVGTWILSQEIDRYGLTWTAVGAYYAGPYKEERKQEYIRHYITYAKRVQRKLDQLKKGQVAINEKR